MTDRPDPGLPQKAATGTHDAPAPYRPTLSISEIPAPMLDVHPVHSPVQTWRDFLVHIAIITIGLLIAIGLEQGVESLHHIHQRHQLQNDLLEEAKRNRDILTTDLGLASQAAWFQGVLAATRSVLGTGQTAIDLPSTPCIPGTIGANGTDAAVQSKYFAPSDAVWATARDAGLIIRLPVAEARMYARLAHNYALQAAARDRFAFACERIDALRTRYASSARDKAGDTWSMNREEADQLADAAATADSALRALLWRTRWNLKFEEGVVQGAKNYDDVLMTLAGQNQIRAR
jgi:hypothetical protein